MSLRHPPRFSPRAPAARATPLRIGALALALFAGVACGDDPNPVEPPAPVDIVEPCGFLASGGRCRQRRSSGLRAHPG